MNNSLKNVLSFIKEALELKNKNIYKVSDYEIHEDFGQFYKNFKEIIEIPDYLSLNINSNKIIFKLKYIKEDKKKKIPEVPDSLKKYIYLKDGNDIISTIDDLEKTLEQNNLLEEYKKYDSDIKEINKYNNLIDSYNSKYMQFHSVYKRINDYEEKIEVIFGQKLMIWEDEQNNRIERYIYEANLDIDIDPINNIISFSINNDKQKGFVTDFLNLDSYKVKDLSFLNDYIKKFDNEILDTEFDVEEEAEKYINYISLENEITNSEFNKNQELKKSITYLFDNCGIIVRNKNIKLWIEDLEKIISMCNDTQFKSPILNVFEIDFSDENQVSELLNNNTTNDNEEILFPLPSNNEQYKIVEKVKSSNIVLVQGPPGTGKSHTIANLLSHYISEGKKVIVTSEKAKALEVLREKIPSPIRSLSLSILTSTGVDKELEFSINNILKHQSDNIEIEKIKDNIASLTEKLRENNISKQEVNKKIIELMSNDTISYKEKLNEVMNFEYDDNVTLMDIAKWLEENRYYSIIPISDNECYNYSNCREFFEKLDDICDDIKNNSFATSKIVPEYDKFKTNDIELYINENIRHKNHYVSNPELINSIKQSNLNDSKLRDLGELLSKLTNLYTYFDKEFIKSYTKYEAFMAKLIEITTEIKQNKEFIMLTEEKIFDYEIEYEKANLNSLINELSDLINLYDENGNLNIINKIKFASGVKKIECLNINGNKLQKENVSKTVLEDLREILKYYSFVDTINRQFKQILQIDLFEKLNIKRNQFGKEQREIINILDTFINFEEYSKQINLYFETMINNNLFKINYVDEDEDNINSIYKDLQYYVIEHSSVENTKNIINEIRDFYKDYNLHFLNDVLVSIETNQLEEYINNKGNLLKEIGVINKYNDLKKEYSKFVEDKNELIYNYIYKMNIEDREFLKRNIDKVLKYHYIEKFYLTLEEKETILPLLYEKRELLINEEKKIITELVAIRGWYYQNINMTHEISLSLNKWVNLKKKLGGGKGKNTNIYLRQMRNEMESAKNAIPVWIMPVDKLIEQYPFTNEPQFDVLIMDESSQTSVFSISALARAKKIIIVGDDKQISPTNSFTSLDALNEIRTKYLRNNNWNLQIAKDTSIYDIIQTICGNKKITLTEHFRCLPEIINYSNKMFYNMEINPLKVRGKENTIAKPIETIYVPNAVCKKSGQQIINEFEINRIITLIADISSDELYRNKTIGIIALQNNMTKHIQKLTELIMHKFGEDFITERKIKIGTAYDFQGDERDVIILSMGITTLYEDGEKYAFRALTTQEFDRAFNVAASRAKEQMVLVHSVKLSELTQECNRYKLLNYCLNYDKEKEKNNEELFESKFEKDIYYHLISKNYTLTPQFKVGNYRLDFVLTNNNNQKIAIECDGDRYHGIDELENDLKRQSILERCGWKFARIRASEYYYNRERGIDKLIKTIEYFLNSNNSINVNIKNEMNNIQWKKTFDKDKNESEEIIDVCKEANGEMKMATKENNKNSSFLSCDSNDNIYGIKNEITNNHFENPIESFGPSQFKYMTLLSVGATRKEIAEYYNVAYNTVKKSLQSVGKKYKCGTAEECIKLFKEKWSQCQEYNNIIKEFNENMSNKTNSLT